MKALQQRVTLGLGIFALAFCALASSSVQATELLMFDRAGCIWCERWDRDVGVIYNKTVEGKRAPLRRINVDRDKLEGVQLKASVRYTPTFVLVDKGREVGRITGYLNDDQFWGLLGGLLAKTGQPKPKLDES